MVEFRWIIFSLFLMLLLNFPAANGKSFYHTVRLGGEVTLSCEHVIKDQDKCDSTHWTFDDSKEIKLIEATNKSDRLSVRENCSLVIKNVTVEDAGRYDCKQNSKSGHQDTLVYLSVVNVTAHEDNCTVTLNCSVLTREQQCRHRVKWLYDVNKDKDMRALSPKCSHTVTFPASYLKRKSELFKCEVTDDHSEKVQLFNSSGEFTKCGDDATTATTKSPTTTKSTSTTGIKRTSVKVRPSEETNKTSTNQGAKQKGWWWIIIVSVGVVAIIIVAVIRWKRTKGNKTQDENMADPEEGVSYATVSYTKKTNSEARLQGDDDDDDDDGFAVTYSAVKVSSSSAS